MSERRSPRMPTIIRMTPTMFRSMPFVSTLTAQARIAPTAIRKMLTPSPM
jgi:hypothetical protein